MVKFLGAVAVLALVAVILAVYGPSLPPGNPLHEAGNVLRDLGQAIGRGFGGGYAELVGGN
ncbi:MAG TPA: hypothetical protein VIA81_03190 [Acidimicrobiia bacterium]|jgi:hypothetical protein